MRLASLFALLLTVTATLPLAQQRIEAGFLDRTIEVAGQSYRYQVYVPGDYTPEKLWPVILHLHGSGPFGADGLL